MALLFLYMNPKEQALNKVKDEVKPKHIAGTTLPIIAKMAKNKALRPIAAAIDHLTYKPYKGYNRLHSQAWNLKNTLK